MSNLSKKSILLSLEQLVIELKQAQYQLSTLSAKIDAKYLRAAETRERLSLARSEAYISVAGKNLEERKARVYLDCEAIEIEAHMAESELNAFLKAIEIQTVAIQLLQHRTTELRS